MVVNYKNIPISVKASGKGKALVLLHGYLENNTIWEEFVPFLEKKFHVIRPDLFGHGETPKFGTVHTMEEMADSVARVLDVFNYKTATLIGHSMGGYITMAFLERYPERVERLLLLNSSTFPDTPDRLEERDRGIRLARERQRAYVRGSITSLFEEHNRVKFKEVLDQHVEAAANQDVEGIVASLKGMKVRKGRTAVLKAFQGKKWIITAKGDPIIPYEQIKKVAEDTGTTLISLPDGHLSYIEQKDAVVKSLKEFLS